MICGIVSHTDSHSLATHIKIGTLPCDLDGGASVGIQLYLQAYFQSLYTLYSSPRRCVLYIKDTSGIGIGGVLQVWRSDQWAFYSRQTRGAEQRYSATELEALALVDTAKHFAYYLYGKSFQVQAFMSAAGIRSSQPQTTSHCDEVATLATHHRVSAQKRKWTCRCPFQGRTSKNGVPHHRDECLSSLGGYWGTPLMKAPVRETGIGSTGAKQ